MKKKRIQLVTMLTLASITFSSYLPVTVHASNENDISSMAQVIYSETPNKSDDAMIAVAETIINRANNTGKSVTEICHMQNQYYVATKITDSEKYEKAEKVAQDVMNGERYFDDPDVMFFRSDKDPFVWKGCNAVLLGEIDNIYFYKLAKLAAETTM